MLYIQLIESFHIATFGLSHAPFFFFFFFFLTLMFSKELIVFKIFFFGKISNFPIFFSDLKMEYSYF